jgi:predicted amino acid-binding ACT domain protein
MLSTPSRFALRVQCPSTRGIVAAISGYLADQGGNISDSAQFDDIATGSFFMRTSFVSEEGRGLQALRDGFAPIAERFGMDYSFFDESVKSKVVVMVTYAKALKSVRADAAFALQSPRPDVRLFCLAAIAMAQSRPLAKAAMFSTGLDGYARVALLRAFENEPRLLAAVDRIVLRNKEKLRRTGA